MVEQIMFFVLGALCAGLVSIIVLPAFWRRAERLVRTQLERQLPLSPREIAAERDQLRAEFCVSQRNLEINVEQARLEQAQDRKQVGQHLLKIANLNEEAEQLHATITDLNSILQNNHETIKTLEINITSLEMHLSENQKTLAHSIETHLDLEQAHQTLHKLADDRAAEILSLNKTIVDFESALTQSKTAHSHTQKNLDHKSADYTDLHLAYQRMTGLADERRREISTLSDGLDRATKRVEEQQANIAEFRQIIQTKSHEITQLQRSLAQAEMSGVTLQKRLEATLELAARRQETIESKNTTLQFKNSALSDAGQQMALLRAELNSEIQARKRFERALETAEKRVKPLEENLNLVTRQSQETARDLTQTIENLQSSAVKVIRPPSAYPKSLIK